LRRAGGGLLAGLLATVTLCAADIAVTDLFRVRTFAEEVYTQAAFGSLLAGVAGDGAWGDQRDLVVGTVIHFLLGAATLLLAAPLVPRPGDGDPDAGWRLSRRSSPRLNALLAAAGWLITLAAIALPIAGLAWKAGLATQRTAEGASVQWSARKAIQMTARAPLEHGREILWSLAVAATAASAVLIVASIASVWGRTRRWPAFAAGVVAAAALAIPGPLVGVGVIALLAHGDDSMWWWLTPLYDKTILAPGLAQFVRALPLAGLVIWNQVASVPRDLLEAAASEGSGPVGRWLWVGFPLRAPGLAAGWLCAFALAVGEVSATLLVYPPGTTPLSVRISQLLHYGVDDRVAALSLAVLLAVLALGLSANWLVTNRRRRDVAKS
ncbi:MAG: ABC transporter permease subunit, partial [Planctomycetales bacterium]|nr:ABC transporter permease subunit [Planctomycetales bacterium]